MEKFFYNALSNCRHFCLTNNLLCHKYTGKKNGVKVSPCRTPTLQLKRFDENPLMHIFDLFFFIFVHILYAYKTFCMYSTRSLYQSTYLHHVSKGCLKSTNAQNNFYLLLISVCIKNCRTKILSVVKKTPCEYNNQI